MPRTVIRNATVVQPDEILTQQTVIVAEGKIESIRPIDSFSPTTSDRVVDIGGKYLAPGLIDLHTHGLHEFDLDNGPHHLAAICELLPRYGVTGFLPTLTPRPKGEDARFVASLAEAKPDGPQIFGFHLEGPFLSLTGALSPGVLGSADSERLQALINAAQPYPAIFSISPEFPQILELIRLMTATGAPVLITHTAADVEQTQAAIEAGARHATHFYDVFPVPEEEEPGVRPCGAVEAILADPRVSVDFILDGVHVHPVAARMALQCKGPDRVCLITDANVGAGLPPGRYKFGEDEVEFAHKGGPARLTEDSHWPGALSGSGLTMDRAVRNAVAMLDIELPQAIRMASTNPAQVLGLEDQKGQIEAGFDADLVVLNQSLEVEQTWIAGCCVYESEAG